MEVVLKVLKDGFAAVHVSYSYGFAIILLTILVKVATFPLTKQQVESTLAMQNLQPKIKAIQQRYAGNQVSIFTRVLFPYLTLALDYSKNTVKTTCLLTGDHNSSLLEAHTISFTIKVAWLDFGA
ncbi:PREDICTED: inner membrane protein ALBINO3, chloroplastic-like [Erythranthe guttata]|uniref:inner membrane protein ALBINO3, chloroplastic-like n=1 Tax=Erythranthe guttata TaxID=4155 RepID=UPI00064E01E8|nr:PREDICTED: inner membrane protein ALBINO3, chloroplastic-like [Erythranthe guttata]|eukprot:XP_012853117.1 PREDICTED: inner membrane protein ALBINO3, chloroplastic-like [Erythranthe guttata]